jgi:hypothetical protein
VIDRLAERLPPRTNPCIVGGVPRKPPLDLDLPHDGVGVRGRLERLLLVLAAAVASPQDEEGFSFGSCVRKP